MARRRREMSQKQLAAALRLTLWDVDRIEAGEKDPTPHLAAIAGITGSDEASFRRSISAARPVAGIDTRGAAPAAGGPSSGRLLTLGAISLLVTVRFFTEVIPVLPRVANFVDIPVLVTLGAAALLTRTPTKRSRESYLPLALTVLAFLSLSVVSAVVNSSRTEPGPVLVFVYDFLAPIGIYVAVYRLWPSGNARALSRTIAGLGLLQLVVVALIDVPRFTSSHNPDYISGTFGTNAYQLVFFLLVFLALTSGIAANEPQRRLARFTPLISVAVLITILLAQYRSLLVAMVIAMAALTFLLGRRTRGLVIAIATVAAFVLTFHFVASNLPALKLQSAASSLEGHPGRYVEGRAEIAKSVWRLYGDLPATIVVGAGPGTYSSRAWQTFANAGSTSRSNVAGSYVGGLTGGRAYSTDVSTRYVLPQIKQGRIVEGSHALSSPYSSYTSLLAEVGILGFALMTAAYFRAFGRAWRLARRAIATAQRDDPLPAVLLATVVAFLTLLQMAALENWLEVSRLTFIAWALLAISAKELDAREPE